MDQIEYLFLLSGEEENKYP